MTMARALTEVTHVRLVEALDFTFAPEGMWGGLDYLGYGRDPSERGDESFVARIGDLYYADVAGNVGHTLYGAGAHDVRVERTFRGLPAKKEVQAGGITIKPGTVAALHMTHRGYIGDHHFFTNEECWYVGADNVYRGENLPFGGYENGLCYAIEVDGKPANLRTQLEFQLTEHKNPITNASVRSILDAIGPICEAEPGILIDDPTPHYRHDDRI